jgi:hypothetical protein
MLSRPYFRGSRLITQLSLCKDCVPDIKRFSSPMDGMKPMALHYLHLLLLYRVCSSPLCSDLGDSRLCTMLANYTINYSLSQCRLWKMRTWANKGGTLSFMNTDRCRVKERSLYFCKLYRSIPIRSRNLAIGPARA